MGDDSTTFHNEYPRRPENKRKYDDGDDPHERRHGFSSSSDRAPRRTGFSGPPSEPRQHERKSGFSAPHQDHYERKSGFSAPPLEPYERKTGFSGPSPPERKSGFSGPNDFERRTSFSGPPGGEFERKTMFSAPPMDFERKSGFSGPPGGGLDRRAGYFGGDHERKSGFSGPYGGDQDRKTGFSDSRTGPPALNDIEVAKQKAAQIAARLVAQDSKRARTDENDADDFSGKFESDSMGYAQEDQNRGHMFQDHSQVHYHSQDRGPTYGMQGHPQSKKMDIPNGRVGVVIGKGGETIKYLQHQSGAKIQITRDADHDPSVPNRQVEIMGTTEQINRAEQMIKDVIAEAEAGGPGPFASGGSNGPQDFGESIQMKVPTNKVGLIIGRGGDTIRSLQSQSGARIQLMHTPTQDYGQERVLTLVGTKQQTDTASELIKEIIEENRTRGAPGGYNQGFRPPGPPQFGPPRALMQPGHGYQQGSFSGPPQSQPYGGYGPPPSAGPPQPYGGYGQPPSAGPSQQSQQSSPHPQQYPPQLQSYGGYSQQSSAGPGHEYSGQPPYGGYPQQHTVAPGQPVPQQTAPQGYYNQPALSPSESNPGATQAHGAYSQQNHYGQGYGQQTQSPYSQQQSYGQTSSSQQGYGYMQQSFGRPNAPLTTEQGVSAQSAHGAKHSGFNPALSQQGGYSQQDSVPAYGQGGSFQPGYPSQGAPQQDASTNPLGSANAPTGASQVGYGYDSQGPPSSSYIQQAPPGQQQQKGSYVAQASGSSMYTTPNQSSAQSYNTQGPAQPNYAVQSHQVGNSFDSRPSGDSGNVVGGASAAED